MTGRSSLGGRLFCQVSSPNIPKIGCFKSQIPYETGVFRLGQHQGECSISGSPEFFSAASFPPMVGGSVHHVHHLVTKDTERIYRQEMAYADVNLGVRPGAAPKKLAVVMGGFPAFWATPIAGLAFVNGTISHENYRMMNGGNPLLFSWEHHPYIGDFPAISSHVWFRIRARFLSCGHLWKKNMIWPTKSRAWELVYDS